MLSNLGHDQAGVKVDSVSSESTWVLENHDR
jgi:hypothetical protein